MVLLNNPLASCFYQGFLPCLYLEFFVDLFYMGMDCMRADTHVFPYLFIAEALFYCLYNLFFLWRQQILYACSLILKLLDHCPRYLRTHRGAALVKGV